MAQVSFAKLASGTFAPHQSNHWIWNNAPEERVWSFTCAVTSIDGYQCKPEVTKVWQTYSGGVAPQRRPHARQRQGGGEEEPRRQGVDYSASKTARSNFLSRGRGHEETAYGGDDGEDPEQAISCSNRNGRRCHPVSQWDWMGCYRRPSAGSGRRSSAVSGRRTPAGSTPVPTAPAACQPHAQGDPPHKSSGDASAHGWWTRGTCPNTRATVSIFLWELYSDGSWRLKASNSGSIYPGGGSGKRVTVRRTCENNLMAGWSTTVSVSIGNGDSIAHARREFGLPGPDLLTANGRTRKPRALCPVLLGL